MYNREIYLMPIGSDESVEHMNITLTNAVLKSKLKKYLTDSQFSYLNQIYEEDSIPMWGLEPGHQNKRTWQQFKPSDVVIFVPTNYNLIVTQITYKIRNKDLAKFLWGVSSRSGFTWELIFFVRVKSILRIDKRTFLTSLGYKENDYLMGNRRVTEKFLNRYGSLENFNNLYSESEITLDSFTQETTEKTVKKLFPRINKETKLMFLRDKINETNDSTQYIDIKGKRIKRNQLIIEYVKEKADYKCQACGFTFEKKDGGRYVETAHIKPLSDSYEDTLDNVVALCANCHKMLDYGNDKVRKDILQKLDINIKSRT
jgi:5-methylcytosine-specific restriction endonuclease McrA